MTKELKTIVTYVIASLIALFVLAPLIWTFLSSLKPDNEIIRHSSRLFPDTITLDHYPIDCKWRSMDGGSGWRCVSTTLRRTSH